ncbi:MAG TPA: histidine phosphatase family protein [Solirubrobacteraceae bacterium]|nr:histidine phosphatase family protein [Solirubrobacteraceae bacterium]
MDEVAGRPAHVLYVLRHAKSSWKEPGLEDHERPLAPRGRKAAATLARHLRQAGIEPSLVLCSSARRARETYDAVKPSGELLVEPALYGATAGEVIERLRQLPESTGSAMVIGHNPTVQLLVLWLASPHFSPETSEGAGSGALEGVREKFPTCALATLAFGGPWRELGPGGAELAGVVRPADLA